MWTVIVQHRVQQAKVWMETNIQAPSADAAWRAFSALMLALGLDWIVAEAFEQP